MHMAQLTPLPITVSCFSKIQTNFTFLALAHPGSPGQRAIKRVYVSQCVCVTHGMRAVGRGDCRRRRRTGRPSVGPGRRARRRGRRAPAAASRRAGGGPRRRRRRWHAARCVVDVVVRLAPYCAPAASVAADSLHRPTQPTKCCPFQYLHRLKFFACTICPNKRINFRKKREGQTDERTDARPMLSAVVVASILNTIRYEILF